MDKIEIIINFIWDLLAITGFLYWSKLLLDKIISQIQEIKILKEKKK